MNQFYWEDYCKMPQMLYLWWVAGTENLSIKYASFIESINKNNIYMIIKKIYVNSWYMAIISAMTLTWIVTLFL